VVTENAKDAPEEFKIPTREEHKRNVRRIWISCICIGLFVITTMAGMVGIMMAKQFSHQLIVSCTTVLFQIIIGGVFTGFTTPYFLETRVNFAVGMEMNRKALQLGTETADNLVNLKNEVGPMVKDAKEMIATFKARDFGKMEKAIELLTTELNGGGKLDRLVVALEKIAARTSEKADEQLNDLLGEAWAPTTPPPVESPDPAPAEPTASGPGPGGS
jgi:hypothetical protein